MTDPLLLDETSCEEEAAWLAAREAMQDEGQVFVRRVTALARGYVLAQQAGRGDLAVADVMGTFEVDRRSAEGYLGEALTFVAHPQTLQALDRRELPLRHARALLDVLGELEPELADRVEDAVLPRLLAQPGRPPARVRELARRVALRMDPAAARERRDRAVRRRHASLVDAGDGMVELRLLVRAEQGLQVMHRAEQATRGDDGTGRTRDQRRADWMVEQLLGAPVVAAPATGAEVASLDGRRTRPVQVLVHVPVVTALGLADEPCDLQEVGPVDAAHGRLLMADAELRKVCVDAVTGQVLHVDSPVVRPVADPARSRQVGRGQAQAEAVRAALLDMVLSPSVQPVDPEPQYRPSAALARTVRTRHPRCDFLTCSTPSRQCDADHHRPYDRGGATSADNLSPRSRWCHQAKQRGWHSAPLPDGTTLWVSPSGRQYPAQPQHEPPPLPVPSAVLPPPAPPPAPLDGPPDDALIVDVLRPPVQEQPAAAATRWPDVPGF